MSESPEIFECEGDYQFDIYRIMRKNNGYAISDVFVFIRFFKSENHFVVYLHA